jgi:hypothetical protein
LLLLCGWGCAPLTRPDSSAPTDPGQTAQAEKPSLLEQHLQRRRSRVDTASVAQLYIAILDFEDRSGFREDVWDLKREMTRLTSTEMAASSAWNVIPFDVVQEVVGKGQELKTEQALECGRIMEADFVLLGAIRDYNMRRFSVGDPLLGGYKSYGGIASLELRALRVADGSELGVVEAERDLIDRDLGLDLLGKPREQDLQFTGLKEIAFGSEAFRETVLGQATMEVIEELLQKLTRLMRPQVLNLGERIAEILSVYGEDVYINVGGENGVRAGHRFEVLPGYQRVQEESADPGKRVGLIEVREVIGARLSSVRVLDGAGSIRAGDRLEPIKPDE